MSLEWQVVVMGGAALLLRVIISLRPKLGTSAEMPRRYVRLSQESIGIRQEM